jgi:hypothetical protein
MLISKIKKKFNIRQTRVYCLGAAKTGTTSFAAMFEENYRSEHEPNVPELTQKVIDFHKGKLSNKDCKQWLIDRDKTLELDVEASHPLGYMAPLLAETFPEAKFVITIRDPLSWLRSRLDFHLIKQPTEWNNYRQYIWSKGHTSYSDNEILLKEKGLFSLDGYLSQYAEQYEILFGTLPKDRTLLVKTNELSNSVEKLASFIGLPSSKIDIRHNNKVNKKLNILDDLDPHFVEQKIMQHCSKLKANFI